MNWEKLKKKAGWRVDGPDLPFPLPRSADHGLSLSRQTGGEPLVAVQGAIGR